MGYQVIKQPDGLLAVYGSITDTWVVYDATPAELLDWFAEMAAQDARREARKRIDAVMAGEPAKVYYQFAMSFEEANEQSREHGGDHLDDQHDWVIGA